MSWDYKDEEIEQDLLEEEPDVVLPLEAAANPGRAGYVAVVGISFDKFKARVEPGDDIPPEYLVDDEVFEWLRGPRGAIKLK